MYILHYVFRCWPLYDDLRSSMYDNFLLQYYGKKRYSFFSSMSMLTKAWRDPWVADGGVGLQIWRLAVNILNKQSWTADQEWSSSLGVWREANNLTL